MKIEIDVDADTSIIRKIVIPVEWNRAEQPTNSQRAANCKENCASILRISHEEIR